VRVEDGTLWLSKPGRMRWEYVSPETKLFLTEANRMTLYVPAEKRVMQTSVKESDDLRAPLRAGAGDDELAAIIEAAVAAKWAGHQINQPVFIRPARSMSQIGG